MPASVRNDRSRITASIPDSKTNEPRTVNSNDNGPDNGTKININPNEISSGKNESNPPGLA